MKALDKLRARIEEATPEQTPDGLVCVIYSGNKGVRLVVDREQGRAIASDEKNKQVVVHRDPALAAMRAVSNLIAGGVA